jgi:aminoglycoside phosphotransferase (APT) family kinase protein
VWSSRREAEPAVRAWSALGAGPLPARLEVLRRRKKSVVFRLAGVGRGGADVIAKQGLWHIALDERATYEVLEQVGIPRLVYYGFHPDPAREVGWLFVEDAKGEPWDPDEPLHRRSSTRWLAALHRDASRCEAARALPERGLGWFREHLEAASPRLRSAFSNPAVTNESHGLIDGMLRLLDQVASRWPEIESACDAMPRTLVHGDFAERNVRVRPEIDGARVLAYDWEVSGWGLPAVDLVDADLAVYLELVRDAWPGLDVPALERFAQLGQLLRGGVAATRWAAESLGTHWPRDALRELPHYAGRILRAFAALGWHGPR